MLITLYIRYEMSYDAFRPHADRVYRVMQKDMDPRGRIRWQSALPAKVAASLRSDYPQIEDVVQYRQISSWFRAEGRLFRQRLCPVDGDALEFFGLDVIHGDAASLSREDASIVLTRSLARKLFRDAVPVGRTVEVQRETHVQSFNVIAVMEDLPTNTRFEFDSVTRFTSGNWSIRAAPIYIRLRPEADTAAVERALAAGFPTASGRATYRLQPMPRIHLYSKLDLEGFKGDSGMLYGDVRDLYPLSVLGLSILIIACINFMNLATARSALRARETGLRMVAGARRRQMVGQFLCESLLFALVALPLSIGLTRALLPQFSTLMGEPLVFNVVEEIHWIPGVAVITGIVSGIYPGLYLSAQRPADVFRGLRKGLPRDLWVRRTLVILQFAASTVLIATTLVVYLQMDLVRTRDLGFSRNGVLVVKIFGPDAERLPLNSRYNMVKQRFMDHPDIVAAAASLDLPGHSWPKRRFVSPVDSPEREFEARVFRANEDFLGCYDIPILAGRNISRGYAERSVDGDEVTEVLINETAARRFGWTEPAGRTLLLGRQAARVVGMTRDFHVRSLREPMVPLVLSAAGSNLKYLHLKIREDREQEALSDIMRIWAQLVPTVPFDGFYIDDYVESKYNHEYRQGALVIRSAILAILLACLGTMGLAAFAAERRTREIAIRKVLGASEGHLLLRVAREFPMLALLAGLAAMPVAYLLTENWLRNFAYRIDLTVWPFLLSVAVTLLIATGTVIHLARNAARTNPVDVLSRE